MTNDIDRKMALLADEWGHVYMAYYPDYPAQNCKIRNHTDEGLPAGVERKSVRGDTFTEALDRAVSQCMDTAHESK